MGRFYFRIEFYVAEKINFSLVSSRDIKAFNFLQGLEVSHLNQSSISKSPLYTLEKIRFIRIGSLKEPID